MHIPSWFKRHGVILLIYTIVVLATEAYYQGDTFDYVRNVMDHAKGAPSRWDPLWEFGHLLWRPLALFGLHIAKLVSPDGFGLPDHLLLTRIFITFNILSGAGLAIAFHSIAIRASGSVAIATLVTTAVLASNAILNYTQTGNAYVTGLFFLASGVWNLTRSADQDLSLGRAALSGVCLALATLFWVPFVLASPAALLIPFVFRRTEALFTRKKVQSTAVAIISGMSLILVAYSVAVAKLGIGSLAHAREWMSAASHGVKLPPSTNVMRAMFGFPRAFLDMGDQGKIIKRYVFHDIYTPTTLTDVVTSAALPLALFYITVAMLLWAALRSPAGKQAMLLFAAAAAPVIVFAIFIFEGGAMERYFPVYPFLVPVVAIAVANRSSLRGAHRALATLLLCVLVVRGAWATSRARGQERQTVQEQRIASAVPTVGAGFFAIATNQDHLMAFVKTYPFHPLNLPTAVPLYEVLEVGTTRIPTWRQEFTARTFGAWDQRGQVWISKRFIAERPLPAWNWVEGEDRNITWQSVRDFFTRCEYGAEIGGGDGFLLLNPSENNRKWLATFATPVTRGRGASQP